jgi:2-dehydro-3-deoxygalactonokinase
MTALLGLDWGTTSLRAYRLGADGAILERREAPAGILQVADGAFEAAFRRAVGDWVDAAPDVPVLAAGMITSRQGWVELPYLACPAGVAELARALRPHELAGGRQIWFVPGLSLVGGDGVPDVIRGEETQVAGALDGAPDPALLVLPGTHSKWVLVAAGQVTWFRTFMTGEVFAVLKAHSILGRLMTGDGHDPDAFRRGVAYAGSAGAGLLGRLFSARTLGLFDQLPASGIGSYLSGLLIGTEIEEALHGSPHTAMDSVAVVGSSVLAARYVEALEQRGLRAARAPDDVAARGMFEIARAAGLVA